MTHFEAYNPIVKPPLLRDKYPRLRDEESDVLRAYIAANEPDTIQQLRTAVPVGEGEVPGAPNNNFEKQVKALSQMKIDAVIDRGATQEIVELKSRATHTAAGQALFYDLLLGERPDEPTTSRPTVAAFRAHPDFERVVQKTPVALQTFPDADRSTATERSMQDRVDFTE